jgi:hypothetical protein
VRRVMNIRWSQEMLLSHQQASEQYDFPASDLR